MKPEPKVPCVVMQTERERMVLIKTGTNPDSREPRYGVVIEVLTYDSLGAPHWERSACYPNSFDHTHPITSMVIQRALERS